MKQSRLRGFTLIELLVVIAIIGILSSVVLASMNSARAKARDAKRAADMAQILKALQLFYDDKGCLPTPASATCATGDSNAGGWDYSSQGSFMPFLSAGGYISKVPVDPINDMSGDGTPAGTHAYRYYCYPAASGNPGLHLGYWKEDNTYVQVSGSSWGNTDFSCK